MPRKLVVITVLLLLVSITAVVFIQARARPNLLSEMQTRLESKGVQVNYIKVLSEEPYSLEIGLQSQSQDDNMLPEDILQLMLTHQEAGLSYLTGIRLDSYAVILMNTQGEVMSSSTRFVYEENIEEPPSLVDELAKSDAEMEAYAREQLELDQLPGLEVEDLSVTTIEVADAKGQMLRVHVSAEDLSPANRSILRLYDNFSKLASTYPDDNSQFIMGQLQYLTAEGKVALNWVIGATVGEMHGGVETYNELGWLLSYYISPPPLPPGAQPTPTPVAYP